MTEIASPGSPGPTLANPAATNGHDTAHDNHQSHDSSDDSELSQVSDNELLSYLPDVDTFSLGPSKHQTSASGQSPRPNGINGANGHAVGSEDGLDGPPAKRRRVRDTTPDSPMRRPKPESPPWKRVEAEGPSTFVAEDGRRKSGRINTIPLELQRGDKRITRRSLHGLASPPRNRNAGARDAGHTTPTPSSISKRPLSSGKPVPPKPSSTKAPTRKVQIQDTKPSARTRQRPSSPRRPTTPTRPAVGTRRSTRHHRDHDDDDEKRSPNATRSTPRIKLRTRPPLTTIPLVHRDQANIRPKLGPSFEEYFERARTIPVEQGGLFTAEDGPEYTDELARHDAQIILRVEREVEPGGILARDRCSVFEPEPEEEPPRQWAHMDHLAAAMANFRKLMLREQQAHRATAKKIALACESEWRRRNPQPKTAEELEQEEVDRTRTRWRLVNKAIAGTWENVKAEVNRRRMAAWEAEEQRRVKAALNQAVNLSEQKLQARQAQQDTEELLDDSEDDVDDDQLITDTEVGDWSLDAASDEGSDASPADDESNMSSSDDDDEDKNSVLSDEGLTQDELREKYANLPSTVGPADRQAEDPRGASEAGAHDGGNGTFDDTSDESVDMDDDLGSTEDESEEDSSNEEDEEDESADDQPSGLLGLFFKKSELKKLSAEADVQAKEPVPDTQDIEMVDADPGQHINGIVEHQPASPQQSGPELETTVNGVGQTDVTADGNATHKATSTSEVSVPSQQFTTTPAAPDSRSSVLSTLGGAKPTLRTTTNESLGDVSMFDAVSGAEKHESDQQAIPQLEISEVPFNSHQVDPRPKALVGPSNFSRGESPVASMDKRVSEVETPTSASLLNVPKTGSRSTSPQPTVPKTEIPFLLRGTLREYQHLGLDWLAALYANNTNGILADEMGLGKTIQTIALLAHLACHHHVWGPHLVIVPTSVMLNWEMEFKKWCPGFKILTYYGNQDERKRKRQGWTNDDIWNVCITSYQMVLQDQQVFRRRRWHYMILDEAHNIKNFKSQRWQTLLGFNTRARLLLTGTPLQNNLTELWSLLYFLAPPENGEGGFVDLSEFHNWFSRPESQILESGREKLDDEARAIISKLHKVLRPYLLRRLKADVEKQMPAKYEHVEFCRLSKRQRELYDGFLSRADTRQTLASGNYMSIINCLMQLRKVCNHPDLFVDRPILTSLRMQRSVAADYELSELSVRRTLLAKKPMGTVSLKFLNMIPTSYENLSTCHTDRIFQLSSNRILADLRDDQKARAQNAHRALDPSTVKSNIIYLESAARWGRFEDLQHSVYLNAIRRQQRPIYGKRLIELLTFDTDRRPFKQRPKVPAKIMSWFEEDSFLLHNAIPTLQQRAASIETTITKFACVTPAVITGDMNKYILGQRGIEAFQEADLKLSAPVKYAPYMPKEPPLDPWHEARMRLSIQFPDKRLLQYDCGKLQALDKLLRKLQAGGHRALIFTQMTKVLDILELFLNIHGHKYLRLDGATKVEQRQILTDRFNVDTRILCFILSTRSGGLGINLTGADTVIFYDQDWNPAMDKQCQDRCHRIGQTRDVHIYRLVSEHTIEANILRKANQKQMLDDVVIQEGEFTTDYFNKLSVRDVIGNNGEISANENDVVANAAMDRVLGGADTSGSRNVGRALEQAEDREDVAAARVAEKEIEQDNADFLEQQPAGSGSGSGVSSVRQGTPRDGTEPPLSAVGKTGQSSLGLFAQSANDVVMEEADEVEYNALGERMHTIDDFMLAYMSKALEGTPLDLPKDKKKSKKKGKDTRKR